MVQSPLFSTVVLVAASVGRKLAYNRKHARCMCVCVPCPFYPLLNWSTFLWRERNLEEGSCKHFCSCLTDKILQFLINSALRCLGNEKCARTFLYKLFEHPQGSGTSRQNPRDIPNSSLRNPRKTNFEGGHELFGHHPFAWKTPTPPGGLWTQKLYLCALFSCLAVALKRFSQKICGPYSQRSVGLLPEAAFLSCLSLQGIGSGHYCALGSEGV